MSSGLHPGQAPRKMLGAAGSSHIVRVLPWGPFRAHGGHDTWLLRKVLQGTIKAHAWDLGKRKSHSCAAGSEEMGTVSPQNRADLKHPLTVARSSSQVCRVSDALLSPWHFLLSSAPEGGLAVP